MTVMKSLALAIEVATQKRDEAGRQLVQVQRAYLAAESQLEQLKSYAQETAAKWAAGAQSLTSAELLRHHYQFMDRLQQAINMQNGVMDDRARRVESAKKVALDAEFRLAGLKQVLKKKQADSARLQARREQRQTDEMAGLLHRRTAASGERR
jgi:flagellar FliJ protein